MSVDVGRYLEMERAFYADLVARSNFSTDAFTRTDSGELVVGSYVHHESLDYERWLLAGVSVRRGALALEYGCGPGRMMLRLAPRFARIDGVDISEEVLDVARRRCATLASPPQLLLTDGQNVPDGTHGCYDLAYSVICLQHICVYSVRMQIFEGLFRALKPGGLLTFQMGYGPGHARMVDYFEDFVDAPGTNGVADVGVLHPGEIAGDLARIGFTQTAYALTPTGPGDTHGAWIFVRALKPGPATALIATNPQEWEAHGFVPVDADDAGTARARQRHVQQGILARCRDAEQETASIRAASVVAEQQARDRIAQLEERVAEKDRAIARVEQERADLEDSLAMARADRDGWRERAADAARERDQLRRQADVQGRQLVRLRVADRRRIKAVVDDLVRCAAAGWRVGVLGAGEHTDWLLQETSLGDLHDLFFFDSDPSRAGATIAGRTILPAREIAALQLDAVIPSSLAFHEEMVGFLEALPGAGLRIVRCYP
jgi:SAM-dependent methyltransferase